MAKMYDKEEDNDDGINITNLFESDSAKIETSENVSNVNTASPEVVIPTDTLHPAVLVEGPLVEIGLGLNFLAHPVRYAVVLVILKSLIGNTL